ncbi:MAG: dephospho-CoA kinase [Phycisphaerae bacterium]|nr:dephospho-CoA kinase [Phycisphaerae bacterium]
MKPGKPIIGLTGGIGSGKSAVAGLLRNLGAGVIDADRLNHEELDSPEVLRQLREWWGMGVAGPDGHADRAAIRRIVGADASQRKRLEDLVHPRIDRRRRELADRYQADPSVRAIVLDAPLLHEVGLAEECDYLIFVDADQVVRSDRVRKRGWTPEDLERFEKSQLSLDTKRDRADYRVVNNSDIADLRRQVEDVFSRILAD